MYSSKSIVKYGVSAILLIFAAGSINGAVGETLRLLTLHFGLNSGYHRVWNGPTSQLFSFLEVVFLIAFALPAFCKVRNLVDVYRRFRWIFAAASILWGVIIPVLLFLTRCSPWELSSGVTKRIPDPHAMSILTTTMTTLLFVRTRKKGVKDSNTARG